jgi:hypothetical protein
MTSYAKIALKVDKGRGVAAKNLGQPFAAYRVSGSSSGDWPDGWQVVTPSFPLFRRRMSSEGKIETGMTRGTLWFELIANMNDYVLGDVFLQTDQDFQPGVAYGPGATLLYDTDQFEAIGFAMHMPVGKSIGARLDHRIRIYRPNVAPGTDSGGFNYWKSTFDNDTPLVLTQGTFAFGAVGATASLVPAGFSAYDRQYGENLFGPKVPGMPKPSRYFCYIPPLPGWTPTEGDAVITEDGARYVVELPYNQEAGVVGSQLVLHRQIRQAT